MRKIDKSTITLMAVILVATLLFTAALVAYTGRNREVVSIQNREYLEDATRRTAANIDAEIHAGYDNIRIVASLLNDTGLDPDKDMDKLRDLMDDSVFDFIEFADTDGWDHTVRNTMTYAGDRKYYLEGVMQGKIGMELIYNSRATHETLLMFYAPVYDKGSIVGAVIGVYQAANRITKLLTWDYFGESALAFLATPEGRIVASSEGYDPAAENYISSLPAGGCTGILEESGWQLVQYFPEEATKAMVADANLTGFLLSAVLFFLYALVLVFIIIYIGKKQKLHQAEMVTALSNAESANRAKTTFLNNMSHDIRTPMNAIMGFNQLALKELGKNDFKVKDCLEKVKRSSEALLTIINDILEISRIEAGKVTLTENSGDAAYSVTSIEPMMRQLADDAGIALQFSFGNLEDRYVVCDFAHVTRILTNLISNAIKYTRKGGWVRVYCEQPGRTDDGRAIYRYTVEDNGMGMSEEFQTHLFQPFSREKSSSVSKIQGTGLGLAMCKDLVELMGGTITCESVKGEGSKFVVTLPFRIQEGEVDNLPKSNLRVLSHDFKGKRILLVEDNELNKEIATAILEEIGVIVVSVEDGDLAVDTMKKARPGDFDLILMDIQMPTIDGYEATRRIRALNGPVSWIPIIAMTANAFAEDRKTAMEAGMDGHVAKPIDVVALKKTLALFL